MSGYVNFNDFLNNNPALKDRFNSSGNNIKSEIFNDYYNTGSNKQYSYNNEPKLFNSISGSVNPKSNAQYSVYDSGKDYSKVGVSQPSAENNLLRNIGGTNTSSGLSSSTNFGSSFGDGLNYGQYNYSADGTLMKGGLFSNSVATGPEIANYNKMMEISQLEHPTFAQQEELRNFNKSQEGFNSADAQVGVQAASALYQGLVADPANRRIARGQLDAVRENNRLSREKYEDYKRSEGYKSKYMSNLLSSL